MAARIGAKVIWVMGNHDDRAALASLLDDLTVGSREVAVLLAVRDRAAIADLLPPSCSAFSLGRPAELVQTPNA